MVDLRYLNVLAGKIGYMSPLPTIISLAPVEMTLSVEGSIARGTLLQGNITIGDGATIERGVKLVGEIDIKEHATISKNSRIHNNVTVGRYSKLNGDNVTAGSVSIGDFCAIAPRTTFYATNHKVNSWAVQHNFRDKYNIDYDVEEEAISIGSDVWVGMDAIVLPGVDIGHGACVGAHSVVTRNVEPYEIVAGNPANRIGWRFDKQKRQKFLDMAWWDWEIKEIIERAGELLELAESFHI